MQVQNELESLNLFTIKYEYLYLDLNKMKACRMMKTLTTNSFQQSTVHKVWY